MHIASVEKSRPKTRKPKGVPRGTKLPQSHGGTLVVGAGRGPAKGAPNAGRPRDEWRAKLQAMASRDEVLAHVEATLLNGPADPFFDRALQYVTDHGYGRAPSSVDITSGGEKLPAAQTIIIGGREIVF